MESRDGAGTRHTRGMFAQCGGGEFLVLSMWASLTDHERYLSERFPSLRQLSGAEDGLDGASPGIWLSSNPPGPSYPDTDAGQRHSLIGIMRVLLELGGEDSAVVQVRCALSVDFGDLVVGILCHQRVCCRIGRVGGQAGGQRPASASCPGGFVDLKGRAESGSGCVRQECPGDHQVAGDRPRRAPRSPGRR
jgi:hypothetical protein